MAASCRGGLAIAVMLALVAVTLAQPCIECKDCKTNNCFRVCQKSCPKTVDGNKCRNFGTMSGMKIGRDSCSTAQLFCKGSKSVGVGARRGFQVTLDQCENIAYGACQARAREVAIQWGSPCRAQLQGWGGFQQCTRQQWTDFFNGEVDELCERAVAAINP